MSEIKLLPCPFCGGEAKVLYNRLRIGHYAMGGTFRVHCKKCGITTEGKKDKNKAIAIWNTRRPMEHLIHSIELIRDCVPDVEFKNGCNVSLHMITMKLYDFKEEGGIE